MSNEENFKISIDPWELPLKDFIKEFALMVSVYDLKNDTLILNKKMDYGNHEHRKLLGKITYWAVTNGYSVETMALSDYEKFK